MKNPSWTKDLFLNTSGMTLVEGIIGLVIATVIMGMIVQTYIVSIRLSQTGFHRAEQLEEAQLVLEYFSRDLHSAIPENVDIGGFVLQSSAKEGESLERLQFIRSIAILSEGKSYPAQIQYTLSTTGQFIRKLNYLGDKPSKPSSLAMETTRTIGLGLKDTQYYWEVKCLSGTSNISTGDWNNEYSEKQVLPQLVKIKIKLAHQSDPKARLEMTRIIRTGGL